MGKTYRKEKPASKRREDAHPGHHDKGIEHAHDRTELKRLLDNVKHHWDDEDALYAAESEDY